MSSLYPLNCFPDPLILKLANEIIAFLATHPPGKDTMQGFEFEWMFAAAISADWGRSCSLTDVASNGCTWSVKTVYVADPSIAKTVRLNLGQMNPIKKHLVGAELWDAEAIGHAIIDIWNKRVDDLFANHSEARTVVLLKPKNSFSQELTFGLFEYNTLKYDPQAFRWERKSFSSLAGFDRTTEERRFEFQPTDNRLMVHQLVGETTLFSIRRPPILTTDDILIAIGHQTSWLSITHKPVVSPITTASYMPRQASIDFLFETA